MHDSLIKVEGVSKKFCRSLKRSLWYGMQDLGREIVGQRHAESDVLRTDEFWAVKDVSFELRRGECLGLIGHNGAGKTTLLRMLNGLIKPDQGQIEIRGRVGALIALGAGFNPILTGRENIYVNASVLGLSKWEIDEKIDEIIDFSEIEEFIDTPVQSYSSGMSIRLGFAIAVAVEPDVILLDEILAVGDVKFRAKCYNKISSFLDKSAVIIVSHNMDQISQVCTSALLLQKGVCKVYGNVGECISMYSLMSDGDRYNGDVCEYQSQDIVVSDKKISRNIDYGDSISLDLEINSKKYISVSDLKITIFSQDGRIVAESYTKPLDINIAIGCGDVSLRVSIGPVLLSAGKYSASIVLLDRANNKHIYWASRCFTFVVNGPVSGSGGVLLPINVSVHEA